jgi:non-specific serine/threonine protein kinase
MTTTTVRSSRGHLPADFTSFVGRRREVAEVRALISSSRLVTVTGIGGVGKTRLARQVALAVRRGFDGGVWEVDLATVSDAAMVVPAIVASLGLRETSEAWSVAGLGAWLAHQHLLLLLDNCQHLVTECAVTADALLRACPELNILATSREGLGVRGEHVYPLGPLSIPRRAVSPAEAARHEAVALLIDRASAIRPGFGVNEGNVSAFVELCRGVDGIPLALELAAVWLRALSPADLVRQLGAHYEMLDRGDPSAPTRQRSLRALIDWSYRLCDPAEQAMWRALSVFSEGFDAESAASISGLPNDDVRVVDLIERLVSKSVLTCDHSSDPTRYGMVQIIKDFGSERLRESGEQLSVRHRHVAWCADLARKSRTAWVGTSQLAWFTRVRRELSNLRAGLSFSVAEHDTTTVVGIITDLTDYWIALGFLSEGRYWLDRACPTAEVDPSTRLTAVRTSAILAATQGDRPAVADLLAEAGALADRVGTASDLAWLAYAAAFAAWTNGDVVGARDLYAQCRTRFTALHDLNGLEWTLCDTTLVEASSEEPERTERAVWEFLDLVKPFGERWGTSYVLWAQGYAEWRLGKLGAARRSVEQSLALRAPFGDMFGLGLSLELLAWITAAEGKNTEAVELLGSAQAALATIGSSVDAIRYVADSHNRCADNLLTDLGRRTYDAAFLRGMRRDHTQTATADDVTSPAEPSNLATDSAATTLTRREREIAVLVAQGMTNKEIAAQLVISQRTAEAHIEHILVKLGFNSRSQIAAWISSISSDQT